MKIKQQSLNMDWYDTSINQMDYVNWEELADLEEENALELERNKKSA